MKKTKTKTKATQALEQNPEWTEPADTQAPEGTTEPKAEPEATPEAKPETEELEVCACGSGFISKGATMCKVCKALYDRDKKRAKAKLKAKARKKLKKNPDTKADELVDSLLAICLGGLNAEELNGDQIAYATKQLAWKLNESLPKAARVEVRSSLIVEGKGNAGGGTYEINAV